MLPRRNVELKARDPEPTTSLAAALAYGAEDHGVLHQIDTYFAVNSGRLKLREEQDGATLIAYRRADTATARTSSYHLVRDEDPAELKLALDAALGTVVVVVKRRRVLLWRDVRIHFDEVDGLGSWVELEAVVSSSSDLTAERALVAELRSVLGITDDRVVAEGYAAMLLRAEATR